jgi:uncharacterized membrane protein YdbT with pleckstrin-like domain
MAKTYLEHLLGEHERILFTARQHWFILATSILFEVIVTLIVFGGTVFAAVSAPDRFILIIIIGFLLILIPVASMVHDILVWANHQYIVTNWRVVQISGIVNKDVIDSSLEKVNDVKMTQSFFGRIFGYGDVEILTASELGVNLFKRIEDPIRFKTVMLNAKGALDRRETLLPQAGPDIPGMISQLDTLRKQGVLSEEEFQAKKAELLAKM